MSYFVEPNNKFSVHSSPLSGNVAVRSWVYYAGTGDNVMSTDNYYFGNDKTFQTLKDFDYSDDAFSVVQYDRRLAVFRDPVERFISTFYFARVYNTLITETLDEFVDNFDEVISKSNIKMYNGKNFLEFMFSPQTYHLGSDNSYYTKKFLYRNINNLKSFLEGEWSVELPNLNLPNLKEPCKFTGHVCEFDLTTRQKNKVKEIYSEDYANGWF